jgi:hypothetical protein
MRSSSLSESSEREASRSAATAFSRDPSKKVSTRLWIAERRARSGATTGRKT